MSKKSKGTNAERELIHKFWQNGFAALRSAGSGSMKYPSPDLLVAKSGKIFAIECKITKEKHKYLGKNEIEELVEFSKFFNAIPIIAIKFKGNDWFFLKIKDLISKNKSFMINLDLSLKKGTLFNNFLDLSIER
jgi:holliday junction resolvase